MKIHPVGAELFQAGRQTDMTKLIVVLCSFAIAPKNCCILLSDKPTWCGFKCSSPYNWLLAYTKCHTKVQYSYCSS